MTPTLEKTSKQLSWPLSNFLGVCLDSLHSRKHEETKPRPRTCGEQEEELSTEPKRLAFAPLTNFLNMSSDDFFSKVKDTYAISI